MADGKVVIDVELNSDEAEKESEHLGEGISSKLGAGLKTVGTAVAGAMAAAGAAVAGVGKAVMDAANQTASYGDTIDKTSQKIGISKEAYQEWAYVFERSGANIDGLQVGMKTLSGVITDAANGASGAVGKLDALGLSVEQLNGLSQEEQLSLVIEKLQGMESGAERTAIAADLLGRSSVDMAAVLNMSADETQGLIDEAHEYGMVLSDEAVSASATFEDSLTRLQGTIGGVRNAAIAELLPSITEIMDGVSGLIAGTDGAGETLKAGVSDFVSTIQGVVPKLSDLLNGIVSAVASAAPEIITGLVSGIVSGIPQIAETGVNLIAGIVEGLASALPVLVAAVPQIVITIAETLISEIPTLISTALALYVSLIDAIPDAIIQIVAALPEIITAICAALIDCIPQIIDAGVQLFVSLITNLPQIIAEIIKAAPQIVAALVKAFINLKSSLADAGRRLIEGLWNGISDAAGWLWGKISGFCSDLLGRIKGFFGISSPSKVFRDMIGKNLMTGWAKGIEDNAGLAASAMSDAASEVNKAALTGAVKAEMNRVRAVVSAEMGAVGAYGGSPSDGYRADLLGAAAARTTVSNRTSVEFTGDLAQLGRVLQPVIRTETDRLGGDLVTV